MDISSLLSSLSDEDIERLKATAQQFFGDTGSVRQTSEQKKQEAASDGTGLEMPFDPQLITGVAKFSKMMNETDEKSAFITALKPLLSEGRKKRADDAVMMLKFFRIISMLQENGR